MGVQAGELELVRRHDGVDGSASRTGGHRQAELLVLVRGGDVLVPAGVDTGGQAHHDAGAFVSSEVATAPELVHRGDGVVDLLRGVDDQMAHPVAHGGGHLCRGLAIAVQTQAAGVGGGLGAVNLLQAGQSHGQLHAGGGVDAHTLLEDDACDLRGQKRLSGVEGLAAAQSVAGPELLGHSGAPGGGTPPQVGLVQDKDGAGGVGEDLGDGQPAQGELAVGRAPRRCGPQVWTVLRLGAGQRSQGRLTGRNLVRHALTSSRGR